MTTNKPVKITASTAGRNTAVALVLTEDIYKEGKRLVETLVLFVYSITGLEAS